MSLPLRLIAAGLLAGALHAGCSPADDAPLVAADVRVTAPRPGASMSAGYLALTNPGAMPVEITAITSPQFGRVEMHRTELEDGIARMRAVPVLVLAPGETLRFEPGGLHLMLMQPVGTPERVTLQFRSRDALLLAVDAPLGSGN